METTFIDGFIIGLVKINNKGNFIKKIDLIPITDKEYPSGFCQISENKFLLTTINSIDFNHIHTFGYIVDSNLNIILKKRLLSDWDLAYLKNPFNMNGKGYRYGFVADSLKPAKGIIGGIDSNLSFIPSPNIDNYSDFYCYKLVSDDTIKIPNRDTLNLNALMLRQNMQTLSTKSQTTFQDLFFYPNPAKNTLQIITIGIETNRIKIYTSDGLLISEFETNGNCTTINTTNFNSGIYYLEFNGCFRKLIIEK